MRYRLLAGLLAVLLPGLAWADPWKNESGHGWGRGKGRCEPQGKRSFWPWGKGHGDGHGRRPSYAPIQTYEGPVGPVVAPPHPGPLPVHATPPHVVEGCPCASSPDWSGDSYAPGGPAPVPSPSALVPVPTPRREPAERLGPTTPQPLPPSPDVAAMPPSAIPQPLPRGPAQAPPPPADIPQDPAEPPR